MGASQGEGSSPTFGLLTELSEFASTGIHLYALFSIAMSPLITLRSSTCSRRTASASSMIFLSSSDATTGLGNSAGGGAFGFLAWGFLGALIGSARELNCRQSRWRTSRKGSGLARRSIDANCMLLGLIDECNCVPVAY